jgi:hypothetical protein
MTMRKVLFAVAVAVAPFAATATTAEAKIDKTCVAQMLKEGFTVAKAESDCDFDDKLYSDYDAKRGAIGWHCDGGGETPYRASGGAKRKRDAVCE